MIYFGQSMLFFAADGRHSQLRTLAFDDSSGKTFSVTEDEKNEILSRRRAEDEDDRAEAEE